MNESNKQENQIGNNSGQLADEHKTDKLADLPISGEEAEWVKGAKRMHKPLVITKELDK